MTESLLFIILPSIVAAKNHSKMHFSEAVQKVSLVLRNAMLDLLKTSEERILTQIHLVLMEETNHYHLNTNILEHSLVHTCNR